MSVQTMGYHSAEDVIQNLKDAGCDRKIIEHFMECMERGDLKAQLQLMERHRQRLLDKVHEEEKKIDCLDYLVYQMGRC